MRPRGYHISINRIKIQPEAETFLWTAAGQEFLEKWTPPPGAKGSPLNGPPMLVLKGEWKEGAVDADGKNVAPPPEFDVEHWGEKALSKALCEPKAVDEVVKMRWDPFVVKDVRARWAGWVENKYVVEEGKSEYVGADAVAGTTSASGVPSSGGAEVEEEVPAVQTESASSPGTSTSATSTTPGTAEDGGGAKVAAEVVPAAQEPNKSGGGEDIAEDAKVAKAAEDGGGPKVAAEVVPAAQPKSGGGEDTAENDVPKAKVAKAADGESSTLQLEPGKEDAPAQAKQGATATAQPSGAAVEGEAPTTTGKAKAPETTAEANAGAAPEAEPKAAETKAPGPPEPNKAAEAKAGAAPEPEPKVAEAKAPGAAPEPKADDVDLSKTYVWTEEGMKFLKEHSSPSYDPRSFHAKGFLLDFFCHPKAGDQVIKFGGSDPWNPSLLQWIQESWHKTWLDDKKYLEKTEAKKAGAGAKKAPPPAGDIQKDKDVESPRGSSNSDLPSSRAEAAVPAQSSPTPIPPGREAETDSAVVVEDVHEKSDDMVQHDSAKRDPTPGSSSSTEPPAAGFAQRFEKNDLRPTTSQPQSKSSRGTSKPPRRTSLLQARIPSSLASLAELREEYSVVEKPPTPGVIDRPSTRSSFLQKTNYELGRFSFVQKRTKRLQDLGLHVNHRGPETSFLALGFGGNVAADDLDDPTGEKAKEKEEEKKMDAGEVANKNINDKLNKGQVATGISPSAECSHDALKQSSVAVIFKQAKAFSDYLFKSEVAKVREDDAEFEGKLKTTADKSEKVLKDADKPNPNKHAMQLKHFQKKWDKPGGLLDQNRAWHQDEVQPALEALTAQQVITWIKADKTGTREHGLAFKDVWDHLTDEKEKFEKQAGSAKAAPPKTTDFGTKKLSEIFGEEHHPEDKGVDDGMQAMDRFAFAGHYWDLEMVVREEGGAAGGEAEKKGGSAAGGEAEGPSSPSPDKTGGAGSVSTAPGISPETSAVVEETPATKDSTKVAATSTEEASGVKAAPLFSEPATTSEATQNPAALPVPVKEVPVADSSGNPVESSGESGKDETTAHAQHSAASFVQHRYRQTDVGRGRSSAVPDLKTITIEDDDSSSRASSQSGSDQAAQSRLLPSGLSLLQARERMTSFLENTDPHEYDFHDLEEVIYTLHRMHIDGHFTHEEFGESFLQVGRPFHARRVRGELSAGRAAISRTQSSGRAFCR